MATLVEIIANDSQSKAPPALPEAPVKESKYEIESSLGDFVFKNPKDLSDKLYNMKNTVESLKIKIDSSKDIEFVSIGNFKKLRKFSIITSDNVSLNLTIVKCDNLEKLVVCSKKIDMFVIANNILLKNIDIIELNTIGTVQIQNNPNLTYLDISKFKNSRSLELNYNNLKSLDISGFPNLEYLYCNYNKLESLKVSDLPNLRYLNCPGNRLKSLNLSELPRLSFVECVNNDLKTVNITNCKNLSSLYCRFNDIDTISLDSDIQILYYDKNKTKIVKNN